MNQQDPPCVYLCDSLANWKPCRNLRWELNRCGITCLPRAWDVHQDDSDGWALYRSRSHEAVEAEVRAAKVAVSAYPNYTGTGRRVWHELWTALESKIPV